MSELGVSIDPGYEKEQAKYILKLNRVIAATEQENIALLKAQLKIISRQLQGATERYNAASTASADAKAKLARLNDNRTNEDTGVAPG